MTRAASLIGPNAIIQFGEAVAALEGAAGLERLFTQAGQKTYLSHPPTALVPEADVLRLHTEFRRFATDSRRRSASWLAGRRTADYILAHRIPGFAQAIILRLPRFIAAPLLGAAIAKHAWTFTGSGRFQRGRGQGFSFEIHDCVLCRGLASEHAECDYYCGAFERLYAVLVDPDVKVVETACKACGDCCCRFTFTWGEGIHRAPSRAPSRAVARDQQPNR